ncbi:MAG TPA: class I SAM-dependent RNA methyltransferase [Alphaproteobacteria bacterium]|nr:class I SAM-dependent RNA methyltransferase [Alphaproteobacteria bacterium]
MTELTVTIDHVGALGDGVAESPGGRLHIPFTAPGDRVRVAMAGKGKAQLVEILEAGPARVAPACSHFGRCGGCAMQHLSADFIADWKRQRVVDALARERLDDVPVDRTITVAAGTRRRATLAATRVGKRVLLGFAERASHRLVDLTECPVMLPELVALIPALRSLLPTLLNPGEEADFALTSSDTGADCVVIRARPLSLADREALAAFAEQNGLARIAWRAAPAKPAEPVAARNAPTVRLGDRTVPLSAGTFLQPSVEGQVKLTELVLRELGAGPGAVADLFCGLGTFALPLATGAAVTAYDSDEAGIATLSAAARGLRLKAAQRDLYREPVTVRELVDFRAAVMDPPRAGAEAQARALADSGVETIVYVSCNPVSFARDAAILAAGGYELEQVTPVDQFQWSPHTELVGTFRR